MISHQRPEIVQYTACEPQVAFLDDLWTFFDLLLGGVWTFADYLITSSK
ncbi:MAG: hypothetical protein U0175_07825 [Caldilineaceae bacterium]